MNTRPATHSLSYLAILLGLTTAALAGFAVWVRADPAFDLPQAELTPSPQPAHRDPGPLTIPSTLELPDPATLQLPEPVLGGVEWTSLTPDFDPDTQRLFTAWIPGSNGPAVQVSRWLGGPGQPKFLEGTSIVPLPRSGKHRNAVPGYVFHKREAWLAYAEPAQLWFNTRDPRTASDRLVALDSRTWREIDSWDWPVFDISPGVAPADCRVWREVLAQFPDGRYAVQTVMRTSQQRGKDLHDSSWLQFFDPTNATQPFSAPVALPDQSFVSVGGVVGPATLLVATTRKQQPGRYLLDWTSGSLTPVSPDDPRFMGYLQMPAHLPRDPGFNQWLARQPNPSIGGGWLNEAEYRGTANLRWGMEQGPQLGNPTGPVVALAPTAVRTFANGTRTYSLDPLTRDLALTAIVATPRLPLEARALDAAHLLALQYIPPIAGAPAPLDTGVIRIGHIASDDGPPVWLAAVPLPAGIDGAPGWPQLGAAYSGDRLLLLLSTIPADQAASGPGDPSRFWSCTLDWPAGLPRPAHEGLMGTQSPPADTVIP